MTPAKPLADDPSARAEAVRAAGEALRSGRLVVFPTETSYGVGCDGSNPDAVGRLRALTRGESGRSSFGAWHEVDPERVIRAVGRLSPAQCRLVRRLSPGPVGWLIELEERALASFRGAAGVVDGACDNGSVALVRVPSDAMASQLIEAARVPIVAESISSAGWGDGRSAAGLPDQARLAAAGVGSVLDTGRVSIEGGSTIVRLGADGTFEIARRGAVATRDVDRAAELRVLFVCSGNTCRSPMAEAIARRAFADAGDRHAVVRSSGTGAMPGAPMSPEAESVLRRRGLDPKHHRARMLDPTLLGWADVVFTMTPGHRSAVLVLDPSAAGRTRMLDAGGEGVPDPIGRPEGEYARTADRLAELIDARIKELHR